MQGVVPCLTEARSRGHWLASRGRRLRLQEMTRLQGIDPREIKQVVSDVQLGKMLGRAMSANVLARILLRALVYAGLIQADKYKDRWATGEALKKLSASRTRLGTKPTALVHFDNHCHLRTYYH